MKASTPLPSPPQDLSLLTELKAVVSGEVRFDALSRTLYATDASIYEMMPRGVVFPKTKDDICATIQTCRAHGVSIVARGAGTGLAGGAVGKGVQLDLSRFMNRIGPLDVEARTIEVEPGVVLDELNALLALQGLQFAPDVATSSRATIGGMIANNSCGARSIVHGRTVDHVRSLSMVLADGSVFTFDDNPQEPGAVAIQEELSRIRDSCYDEITHRFPKILRSNGGYGLDRLGKPGTPAPVTKILCGSEGTLGIVVRATLDLVPVPTCAALVVLHYETLLDALGAVPAILKHEPSAVELVDRSILTAGRDHPGMFHRCHFLQGDPAALLLVEFQGNTSEALARQIEAFTKDQQACANAYAVTPVLDRSHQADVWELRKAGLGLLMSRPGDAQPIAFVEDSAVDPARLRDYIERFNGILAAEGVKASHYAHASVGCIHVRPVINLRNADDVGRMRKIAEAVSDLACEFGGTMTGEHGDGIARSCWLQKLYGPRIMQAFGEVKSLFDPDNVLNPNKIVDALNMNEHLRFGGDHEYRSVKTHLDFSEHGGMAQLAGMCSGVGQCRQRLVGVMCPSYVATLDENHTTRARANALRVALSNRGLLDGMNDPHLAEVMDLCISCKACKSECPTGVDMGRLKSEYLAHRIARYGASRRARLVADLPSNLSLASRFPRMSNAISQSSWMRAWMQRHYGVDRRVPPPRLAKSTFRQWFKRHKPTGTAATYRGEVVYFVDTWTNFMQPQVGIAAVTLLEHAGFTVHCPETVCCGRPAISQGLLAEARLTATKNVDVLSNYASAGIPIVGSEPSCVAALVDEYPQLLRYNKARRVASGAMMVETFLRRLLDAEPSALRFSPSSCDVRYHAHCHQKSLFGSADALSLMKFVWGQRAAEISSGCCGMAGSFGHEVEHYEVARAMGEDRLFPAIRENQDARIAVSGFSCRHQIEHHTCAEPQHLLEYLALDLAS